MRQTHTEENSRKELAYTLQKCQCHEGQRKAEELLHSKS